MNELTAETRFSGLADGYDRHRPSYPDALWTHLVSSFGARAPQTAADVGAGTGISTRQLALALGPEWQVIGVEPNDDMRAQAEARGGGGAALRYIARQAENLGFKDVSLGLVTTAQAIHWFDKPRFYQDVGRSLAPGGILAILYNDRDVDDGGLLSAFETLMEDEMPGYDRNYRRGKHSDNQDEELATLAWAGDVASHHVTHAMPMTPEGFAGLMLSRSKLKPFADKHGSTEAERILIDLASGFADAANEISLRYTSRVHMARKA
jgi:ubiquinone/menaquinone biosynthesis C-methylase UbiE